MKKKTDIKIGTSGYSYPWNKGKPTPFEWYLAQGLNSVEINGTFYRFPTLASIKTWQKAPEGFDFTIKVNQAITHRFRMNEKGLDYFSRFAKLFEPMNERIAFFLFQMAPSFRASDENLKTVEKFLASKKETSQATVIEFREKGWWDKKFQKAIKEAGAVFCSVDAPELPQDIITMNDSLYLRLHGRKSWYSHIYSDKELDEICERVRKSPASGKYTYLNNDHGMLPNAFYLRDRLFSK